MRVFNKVIILILTIILSLLLYYPFYYLYPLLFVSARTGSLFMTWEGIAMIIMGAMLAYIFFLALLFTTFGGPKKYWWIGILLIPAAAFEVYFDWSHIYFPIAIGLIGWLLGFGISKLLPQQLK